MGDYRKSEDLGDLGGHLNIEEQRSDGLYKQ